MAISDSYDFSITRNDIFQDALEYIGVLGEGIPITAEQQDKCNRALNMLVQQISTDADFSPGKKVWARKRAYLFLQKDQVEYDLGPAGDHCADSYASTTLTASAAGGATSLTVDSIAGISDADNIGIYLDDGTMHWDTVNGTPSGSTVTLTTGIASAASSDARVFAYTSKIQRPQRILSVVRRNIDGDDSILNEIIDLSAYEAISDKDTEGAPTDYLPEAMVDSYRIILNVAPEDLEDVLRITYHRPLSDFDAASDTPDFPKVWYRYLVAQLAIDVAPKFSRPVSQDLKDIRDDARAVATHEYPENTVTYFEPDRLEDY